MKKLIAAVIVLVAGLLAFNYLATGQITLIPSSASSDSDEGEMLLRLEGRFQAAKREFAQASRAAALGGADMTGDAEAALREVDQVHEALKDLKPRLTTDEARGKADRLESAIKAFRRALS